MFENAEKSKMDGEWRMRTNPLFNKGFLLCMYSSIINVIIFGYTLSIKEVIVNKNKRNSKGVAK